MVSRMKLTPHLARVQWSYDFPATRHSKQTNRMILGCFSLGPRRLGATQIPRYSPGSCATQWRAEHIRKYMGLPPSRKPMFPTSLTTRSSQHDRTTVSGLLWPPVYSCCTELIKLAVVDSRLHPGLCARCHSQEHHTQLHLEVFRCLQRHKSRTSFVSQRRRDNMGQSLQRDSGSECHSGKLLTWNAELS